jgi:hypothetical protein
VDASGESLIVGRTRCGGRIWMLNDIRQLLSIDLATKSGRVTAVRGLRTDDKPWGLACLKDESLWTLASSRLLVRLSADGEVRERINLRVPWVGLFESAGRLLYQPVSTAVGSPALAIGDPHSLEKARPWPAISTRAVPQGVSLIAHNLIRCGLARGPERPCWFATETDVAVSDGATTERHGYTWVRGPDVDPSAPLRDVAIANDRLLWLLTTGVRLIDARSVGQDLILAERAGGEIARTSFPVSARLILDATSNSCLLLAADGTLIQVSVR